MGKPKPEKSRRTKGGIFKLILMLMGGTTGILFTLFFSVIGGLMIGFAGYELSSLRASLQWPNVSGEIVTSEVAETVHVSRNDEGRVTSRQVSYSSNIIYRFKVKGKEYTGDRTEFDVEVGRAEAENTVRKYSVGQYVTVYYAPENPSNAVLVPGGDEYFYRTTIKIGYIVLIIAWATFPIIIFLMVLVGIVTNFPRIYAARKEYYDEKIIYILKNYVPKKTILAIAEFFEKRHERLRKKKELEESQGRGGRRKKSIWDGVTLKNAIGFAVLIPMAGLALMMWMPFGFHFLSLGIEGVFSSDDGKYWPTANGLVVKSEMKRLNVTTRDRTTSTGNRYDLTVVVEYRVRGKNYTLNKRDFSGFPNEKAAREALNDFPKGNYVEVYYNPSDPGQVFLYPQERPGFFTLFIGLFMVVPIIIGALVLLWLLYRRLRWRFREEPPPEPA